MATALVVALGAHLRVKDLRDVVARSPDERVYTAYARQLIAEGWPAMPDIVSNYLRDPGSWDYPPPTRLSTLALVSGVMGFSGAHDERAGAWVACAASILSLVLVALIGWRWFSPAVAFVAAGLMTFSLTELAGARRAWQDTTLGAITLATVLVTAAILRQPRASARYAGFFALGVILLLTKQTGVLVYAICAAAIAVSLYQHPRRPLYLIRFAAAFLGSWIVAAWMLCVAAGGLQPALAALHHSIVVGAGAQAYMANMQSTSASEFLAVVFMLNPFLFLMEVFGIGVLLRRASQPEDDRRAAARGIQAPLIVALFFLAFLAFVGFYPGAQNLRFFSPGTGAGYLLAAVGVCGIVERARRKSVAAALIASAVLAVAAGLSLGHEYALYQSRIVAGDLQDLCVKWLHG